MKALQFVGDNKCVVNELPVPEIGDDEVLLASRSVGICHSDIELLGGRYIIPFDFPVIPGHEWSAEVVRVGRAVKGLEPGDRVVGARVLVAEPASDRGDLALQLGADVVIDPTSATFVDEFSSRTGGAGASVVFEASGKLAAMATALEVAAFRARLVYIGIDVGGSVPARLGLFQSKELQARGIIGSPGVWPQTLRFLSRSGVDLSAMVTSSFALAQADQAMKAVLNDPSQVKV